MWSLHLWYIDNEKTVHSLIFFPAYIQKNDTKMRTNRNNICRLKDEPNPDLVLTENHCENTGQVSCAFSSKRLCALLKKAKNIATASPAPLKCYFLMLWKPSHRYTFYTHSKTTCTKLARDSFLHTNSHCIFNDLLYIPPRRERLLLNDT